MGLTACVQTQKPRLKLSDEPIEVNKYRKNVKSKKLSRPTCGARCKNGLVCGRRGQLNGFYCRTDIRHVSGRVLAPLEIPRYRCQEHGTIPWLPWFLARYIRYLAKVVDQVLTRFAETLEKVEHLLDSEEDVGPDGRTLFRWTSGLVKPDVHAWLRQKHEGLPEESFSDSESRRSAAVKVLRVGMSLAQSYAPEPQALAFSPYLQSARLACQ